jgi:hypothetical protein
MLTSPFPNVSQTTAPESNLRVKPAAYADYDQKMLKSKKPIPKRMKVGLRIYRRGVMATKPCKHCKNVAVALSNFDASVDPRSAVFSGHCIMPGKAPKEDGGCCLCVGAGLPGCDAECEKTAPALLAAVAANI